MDLGARLGQSFGVNVTLLATPLGGVRGRAVLRPGFDAAEGKSGVCAEDAVE